MIVLLTYDKKIFDETFTYQTRFNDAIGLSVSTPIMFKGFRIGRITDFSLNPENLVDAEFIVYEEYVERIVEFSALNKSINPVSNTSSIDLLEGPYLDRPLAAGAYVPSIETVEGAMLLREGKVKKTGDILYNILTNLNVMLESFNMRDSMDANLLTASLERLYELTNAFDGMSGNLNNLVQNLDMIVKNNKSNLNNAVTGVVDLVDTLKESGAQLNHGLRNLDQLINNYKTPDGLGQRLFDEDKVMLPKVDTLLQESNKFMKSINVQSYKLPLIIDNLQRTLNELKQTLEGVNNSPLIKYGIPETEGSSTFGRRIR